MAWTETLPIVSCAITITELLRHVEVMVRRFKLPLLAKLPHLSEIVYTTRGSVCIVTCEPSANSTVTTRSVNASWFENSSGTFNSGTSVFLLLLRVMETGAGTVRFSKA